MTGDAPLSIRILPSQTAPRLTLAAGIALSAVLLLYGSPGHGPDHRVQAALYWVALSLCVLTALGCAWRLFVQLPIIEASELGIAIWFGSPYHRPFFAPWGRVRAIVLTRARARSDRAGGAGREALGIELDCDDQFRLPEEAARTDISIEGAARANLAWSARSIGGDMRRWVELLGRMHSIYRESIGR
jgi:hypothetical protein